MMLDKAALEIDRLPVLNVDEELIGLWQPGESSLRNIRNLSKNASLDATTARLSRAATHMAMAMAVSTAAEVPSCSLRHGDAHARRRLLLQANELAVFTMLEEKTAEIRKKMTLKYQVEF